MITVRKYGDKFRVDFKSAEARYMFVDDLQQVEIGIKIRRGHAGKIIKIPFYNLWVVF